MNPPGREGGESGDGGFQSFYTGASFRSAVGRNLKGDSYGGLFLKGRGLWERTTSWH